MPAITVKPSCCLLVHPDFRSRNGFFSTMRLGPGASRAQSAKTVCGLLSFYRKNTACLRRAAGGTPVVPARSQKIIVVALITLAAAAGVQSQTLNVRIAVASTSPARIQVTAQFSTPTDVISFPNAYGNALGLADRIENVAGRDVSGQVIEVRKLAPGEFQTSEKINQISYEVNLSGAMPPAQHSHVSSLNSERGLLMLSDLLPRSVKGAGAFSSVQVQLGLPAGWTAESNTQKQTSSVYFTEGPDKAVFLVGPQLQRKAQRVGASDFSVVLSGDWPITDKDVLKVAGKIVQEYSKLTGFELRRNAVLMLVPFPSDVGPARWTAETRGNAVVLLMGQRGSGKQIKSRLGIVLAHEVFHLWVPNSLNLDGDYDWFFEGFTIYQALRMDLRLHLISFNDYLDTIARVYDSYLSSPQRDTLSLVQASERRWTTSTSVVYDKAMLVAFLYDLQLRASSGCKASLADLYRQLFQRAMTRQADANETIIRVLNEQVGQQSFARQYIEGVGVINLESVLSPYGIIVSHTSSGTKLSAARADKAQKKVLNCLARN
jgi:predicted metalloprotease with PDZ domain